MEKWLFVKKPKLILICAAVVYAPIMWENIIPKSNLKDCTLPLTIVSAVFFTVSSGLTHSYKIKNSV